ncbi:MAG: transglycosylase SLT domain-containing protein [Deltaproteobacteria bacterium]|nr:transglycosylase SLT domain-containing protein [Deltaproteobacteria bacterium]
MKKYFFLIILFFLEIPSSYAVLPLPYPIDYLEKIPAIEKEELTEAEQIEEAPPTEFAPITPPDFRKQKALGYEPDVTFRVPPGLKDKVDFWKLIYHYYSVDQYVLHDSDYNLIYKVVDVSDIHRKNISYRAQRRLLAQRLGAHKRELRVLLTSVHQKQAHPDSMTAEERKIFDLFRHVDTSKKFWNARYNIRSQLGQKERFQQGIIWAGRYLPMMENIFQEEGVPIELTRLPFVESSFNIKARSKVGASGVWQFIRSTGRRYLSINAAVDERNDPIEATRAAAKLLKANYGYLGHWPLAVTAYNHGAAGMQRAVRKVGTKDMVAIIDRYRSRTFGFASKNFYAEFLAALETELEYQKYFGALKTEASLDFEEVDIQKYVGMHVLTRYTDISKEVLKRYNPGLTSHVFAGKKFIPPGYRLKLPHGAKEAFLAGYQDIPSQLVAKAQKKFIYHRVRRGDTLIYLARFYDTSVGEIRRANRIGRFLYSGQTLIIPK